MVDVVGVGEHIGEVVDRLALETVWLVDPTSGREGRASLRIESGRITTLTWLESTGEDRPDLLVLPGLTDLHVHARQPGDEDAETVASALAAAGHGGFTRICLMPNTRPPIDEASAVSQLQALARASGSPVRIDVVAAISAGRAGATLAPMAELAEAGAIAFSDDGAPVDDAALLRHALAYAGALDRPIIEHAEDRRLTEGAEMHDGVVATILGLRGWPAAGEATAVARAIAVLDEVARAAPRSAAPRLHLTHLSTAAALAHVRAAKAAGLAVTCDVTPHHLAMHDGWVAGDRRWAWQALGSPWGDGPTDALPYDTATRVNPPLRPPSDAAALAASLRDGTIDAIATDHAPHTEVAKLVEFGDAANGIAGLETALGQLLAAVDAGVLDLLTVARALSIGPSRVLDVTLRHAETEPATSGLAADGPAASDLAAIDPAASELAADGGRGAGWWGVGMPADLVVIDRAATWRVTAESMASRSTNTPLLGRELPGRVLATVAGGRWAWRGSDGLP